MVNLNVVRVGGHLFVSSRCHLGTFSPVTSVAERARDVGRTPPFSPVTLR